MSPRVQVPLAGAACLAALAGLTLHLLDVPALSPSAARLGVAIVAASAYPLLRRVFVGAADRIAAFRWAIFAPIVLAAITGDAVYFALRVARPDGALSFAQMPVDGFVPVTILSALAGASGAAVLAGEVAFVLRARAADPANGAGRVVVVAWGIAATAGAFAVLAGATWAAFVPAIGVAALAVRALLSLFVRRSPAPARSPYRG